MKLGKVLSAMATVVVVGAAVALAFPAFAEPERKRLPPQVGVKASPKLDPTPVLRVSPPPKERTPLAPGKLAKPVLRGRVNLNTATIEELDMLPGIGPAKARRIVRFRRRRGRFRRVVELRRVKGFGRKTVARLIPFITVRKETTLEILR